MPQEWVLDVAGIGLIFVEAVGLLFFFSWLARRTRRSGYTAVGVEHRARALALVGISLVVLALILAFLLPRALPDTFLNAALMAALEVTLIVVGMGCVAAWTVAFTAVWLRR
jgi:hypothetical protein